MPSIRQRRTRRGGVGAEVHAVGDHLLIGGRDQTRRGAEGRRPLGRSSGHGKVRVPVRSATLTLAPTPSIHAVPVDPTTRVITMGGPRSPDVLCSMPTAPERIRKCTTKPSSAVMGRVGHMGQGGADRLEVAQGDPDLVDQLRAVRAQPAPARPRVGPPVGHPAAASAAAGRAA